MRKCSESPLSMDPIRFEDFDLDARSFRLRRSGQDLKLERIPLELLLLLAGQPGSLVTREQIVEKLWGQGVHLDTENAINTAVRKIRLALGDDPVQPRFVQTVTGKGYRFIARLAGPEEVKGVPAASIELTERDIPAVSTTDVAFSTRRRKRWPILVVTVVFACLGVFGIIVTRLNQGLPRASNYVQITNDGQAKQGPLLTDGLRLYVSEGSPNHRMLAQVSVSGGDTTVLPNSLETPYLMDIAPSRSILLAGSLGPGLSLSKSASALWMLTLPAARLHRAGGVVADDAAWSPDGREIAYVTGNDLYRGRSDGTGGRKLATLPGAPSWLRWSPDETCIRLTLADSATGFSSIWEISADGKSPHPVLPGWNPRPSECCGSWTPGGKYFIFQSTHEDKTEIWAMREKRGLFETSSPQPVQLTAGQINSLAPVLSPNGKKLYVIGQQLRGELVHYDAKSGEFLPYLSGMSAEFVDFSRDGKWVTYVTFPEHTLWRSRIDGSERLQLTLPPIQATVPRWSPDAKRIAFFDTAPGKPWRIYMISADGGAAQPLLEESRNQLDPNWSPDGNFLMFSYFPILEKEPAEEFGIYIIDLRTRNVKKVAGSGGLWAPRWSLDGSYVVARSLDPQSLMLFDFKTQTWSQLLAGEYFGFANWSTDGEYVYYLRRGRQPAVLRVRVTDRKVEEIANLKDVRQTGFRGGIWTGLTPDGSPLILRDIGTQEIYALDFEIH
jgi:Tol biopolymer transport system component/DNA-binding winged helix-turn-helix (wHTH) protein